MVENTSSIEMTQKKYSDKLYVFDKEEVSLSVVSEPVVDYSNPLFEDQDTEEDKERIRQHKQNTEANLDTEPWQEKCFSHPEKTIRLATSFSGIGAIEHAFQRLGLKHEIVFAGDIEPKCKQSYFANYKITEEQWHSDIHELDATPYLGKVDLFVGGAPCQAFSMVGKRRGFDDTRGTLCNLTKAA